ncbi:hypothetical protein B0H66DRAFT_119146 [Apodospora peruviana]|uniref:Uncharacterized protein n=1 Tax=Apodospora peruviana TaxID=516989 RepID=A0AAE0IHX4_9PEZI|nr:hypothetical protein B0H66DRAFT_119146 [Apodospora peruviana]
MADEITHLSVTTWSDSTNPWLLHGERWVWISADLVRFSQSVSLTRRRCAIRAYRIAEDINRHKNRKNKRKSSRRWCCRCCCSDCAAVDGTNMPTCIATYRGIILSPTEDTVLSASPDPGIPMLVNPGMGGHREPKLRESRLKRRRFARASPGVGKPSFPDRLGLIVRRLLPGDSSFSPGPGRRGVKTKPRMGSTNHDELLFSYSCQSISPHPECHSIRLFLPNAS